MSEVNIKGQLPRSVNDYTHNVISAIMHVIYRSHVDMHCYCDDDTVNQKSPALMFTPEGSYHLN